MKKIKNTFLILLLLLGSLYNISGIVQADTADNANATQFVQSVTLSNNNGPIGPNKISDSSAVNVTYNLAIPNDIVIAPDQVYSMPLPAELRYSSNDAIVLKTSSGVAVGSVTIKDGTISILFNSNINTLSNRNINFNFWSNFNKNLLNYETGNDLAFPTKDDPNNTSHLNFSKSSSGGSSGASAISKNLRYGRNHTATWTVIINNGGDSILNSIFVDKMGNTQEYIPGSTVISYRNYQDKIIHTDTQDLVFTPDSNGEQTAQINFGRLYGDSEEVLDGNTSIIVRYQTKLKYNPNDNRYPNSAFSYDDTRLIDSAKSTATYRNQGGGVNGDEAADVIVKYTDDQGKPLTEDIVQKGILGQNYTTDQKDFEGYTLKEILGNPSGQFSDTTQTITYIYTKNKVPVHTGTVITKYIDTKGNILSEAITTTGNIGTTYQTKPKEIAGYTLKEVEGNREGVFENNLQTITYIYEKNNPLPSTGSVIVKYEDEEGNAISESLVKTGHIGNSYITLLKNIQGYKFKEVIGNKAGEFTDTVQTVTYVYTKEKVIPPLSDETHNISHTIRSSDSTEELPSNNNSNNKLPRTGESNNIALHVGGFISMILALLLFYRKLKEVND